MCNSGFMVHLESIAVKTTDHDVYEACQTLKAHCTQSTAANSAMDEICSNIICSYCTNEHTDHCFHCYCGDNNGRFEGRKLHQ